MVQQSQSDAFPVSQAIADREAPARSRSGKDRRGDILDAAAKVITQRGLAEARIADVAELASVSTGLVLYYFESKERLLSEALMQLNDRYYLRVSRELGGLATAREQLERLIDLSVPGLLPGEDRREEWVLWVEVWAKALRDPVMAKEREILDRRWRDSIATVIRAGQASGEFPQGDAEEIALRLASMMDGLSIQVVMNDATVTPERMKRTCMQVAEREVGFGISDGREDVDEG